MNGEWKKVKDGYVFEILFNQDQSSLKTKEVIECELEDKDKFNKICNIISHLDDGISKYFDKYTEKVAEYISKKTEYSETEIFDLIEPIIHGDIRYDHMALVSSITVFKYENGQVQVQYLLH